jgi:hypothetical protein
MEDKYKSPSRIHRVLWGKSGGGIHCVKTKKNSKNNERYYCRLEERMSKEDKINV